MSKLKDLLDKIGKETVRIIEQDITKKGLIRTGRLLNSIEYSVEPTDKGYFLLFDMEDYGYFLDQGTKKIDAREFFEVHINDQLDKYDDDIANAFIEDELEDFFD